jgi:hypothetical protein
MKRPESRLTTTHLYKTHVYNQRFARFPQEI